MDFLNKLSAKAGETFQTIKESDATKKAKNYAEIPGLSLQVGKHAQDVLDGLFEGLLYHACVPSSPAFGSAIMKFG